jgi:hypothetical protein
MATAKMAPRASKSTAKSVTNKSKATARSVKPATTTASKQGKPAKVTAAVKAKPAAAAKPAKATASVKAKPAAAPKPSKAGTAKRASLRPVVSRGAVVVINDDPFDGIMTFSPFTGQAAGEGAADDPSLVYEYLGAIGELSHVRSDVEEHLSEAFEGDDAEGDAVSVLADEAEAMSAKLAKLNLPTVTFVIAGGWNGIIVRCYEVGSVIDGEWTPLVER